jgi:AbrB family looped-hinge helix DNA binding protein
MMVTDKGQVTIPKQLRDQLGLGPGTDVEFVVERGQLVVRRSERSRRGRRLAERLRGRGDVPLSTDEIMALTRAD